MHPPPGCHLEANLCHGHFFADQPPISVAGWWTFFSATILSLAIWHFLVSRDTLSQVHLCPPAEIRQRFHLPAKKISSNGKKISFAGKRDFILWQKRFLSKVAIAYFALAFAWTQLQLLPRLICKHISILGWFGICFKWLNFQGNRKSSDDLQPTGCTSTVRLCISSKVEQWQERCWSGCHWNQMQGSVSAAPLLQLILPNLYNRHCCCWSRFRDVSKVLAEKK